MTSHLKFDPVEGQGQTQICPAWNMAASTGSHKVQTTLYWSLDLLVYVPESRVLDIGWGFWTNRNI